MFGSNKNELYFQLRGSGEFYPVDRVVLRIDGGGLFIKHDERFLPDSSGAKSAPGSALDFN